jgi:hypothetical protein
MKGRPARDAVENKRIFLANKNTLAIELIRRDPRERDKLLHAGVNEVRVPRSFYCDRLSEPKTAPSVARLRSEEGKGTNKSPRTHCGDNIGLLIDENVDRELVSISTVSRGLFFLCLLAHVRRISTG